ncbi:GTPase IMAP family member 8-like [Sardina pilchardus]|uniref:GTPase IMAP family member 8-like n=1 Tax=Sardina pilchardus TaxID=27697 RepID=UPI002E12E6F2
MEKLKENRRAEERKMKVKKQREFLRSSAGGVPHISDMSIVLLGNRLTGKSSSGNTILGREEFSTSGRTAECVKREGQAAGRHITVVEAPGWWRSYTVERTPERDKQEIVLSVSLCPPGPHALLLVINVSKSFTETHRRAVQEHMELLGERVWSHTIVLFTKGVWLGSTSIEQHIESGGEALQWVVEKCGNRYHVVDNMKSDEGQVTELLEKIEEMVAGNMGHTFHFSKNLQEKKKAEERRAEVRKMKVHKQRQTLRSSAGPHALLLHIRVDVSFTETHKRAVQEHMELLGERVWKHTIVLFTRGDWLGDTSIEQHIESEGEDLKWVVEKCGNRYHVVDNEKSDGGQVTELLQKIEEMVAGNRGHPFYFDRNISTNLQEKKKEEERRAEERKMKVHKQRQTLRSSAGGVPHISDMGIVLLGDRNEGKSSSGNTILGREEFITSGRTAECVKREGATAGRHITVVEAPGWWSSKSVEKTPERDKREIVLSVSLCPPGPHALLLIIRVSKSFTETHRRAVQEHMELLGERVWSHTIVLFTRGDWLGDTSIEQHIESEGEDLQWVVEKCGNRYHVVDNEKSDGDQVTELLQKIEEMVAGNMDHPVSLCPPGPHGLLLPVDVRMSFTETDRRAVQEHMELLGERVWSHTIVLFTWGVWLGDTSIEQHIESGGEALQWVVEKCGNRYHVVDNEKSDGGQVTELLEKIEEMVAGNGGCPFQLMQSMELAPPNSREHFPGDLSALRPAHEKRFAAQKQDRLQKHAFVDVSTITMNYNHLIGRGSYGAVYRGSYQGTPAAIKIMPIGDSSVITNEFLIPLHLSHPNIVRMMAVATSETEILIANEYIHGANLQQVLYKETPIKLQDDEDKLFVALEIAMAIDYIHGKQIIHQDLKPANIMITADNRKAYLTDWGMANWQETMLVTRGSRQGAQCGPQGGTPPYMAPECLVDCEDCSTMSDMWSLGITLLEMFTNSEPWSYSKIQELRRFLSKRQAPHALAKLQPQMDGIIKPLLDYESESRMTAEELVIMLKSKVDLTKRYGYAW